MHSNRYSYLALIITVLFWGLSFVAIKIALLSFTPFVYIFIRFALASCFFLLIFCYRGFPSLSLKDHRNLVITALLQPGLYFTFETMGLTYTSASNAAIIIALVPIFVLILARIFLGELISRQSLLGILLSFAGIIVLVAGGTGFHLDGAFIGDLFILGAVIAAAFYTVLARSLGQSLSPLEITGFQIIYGTLLFAPLFFIKLPGINWGQISTSSIIAIIFLAFFATVAGFLCYNYALSQISASRAAVFQNGIPVVTAVGAWMILGEKLTLLQVVGGCIVLMAVFLTNASARHSINKSELP